MRGKWQQALGRLGEAVPSGAARLFGVRYGALADWQKVLWKLALGVGLLGLVTSAYDCRNSGGYDLRIRVVGARLLLAGQDPYTWTSPAGGPETLQDPGQVVEGLSRCSYVPPLLLAYGTFSRLPYPVQRGLWMVLEWSALGGVIALLARLARPQRVRYLLVMTLVVLVAGGYLWRFHVERGQYYVFITLLLSGGTIVLLRRRADHAGAGVLLGLAVALRPTVAVLLLPLWLGGLRRAASSAALTALALVLLTLPFAGVSIWRHYAWLAGEWEREALEAGYLYRTYPKATRPPQRVEGYLPDQLALRAGNVTLGTCLARLRGLAPALVPQVVLTPRFIRGTYLVVLAGFLGVFYLGHRVRPYSVREVMTAGAWLVLLTDFFIPMRVEYADVLFCLPMALAMPALARARNRGYLLLLLLAWVPMLVGAGPDSTRYWFAVAVARSLLVMGVCALPLVASWRGRLGGLSSLRLHLSRAA